MRVLSLSTIFPSHDNPAPGVFIKQRLAALPDECETTVLRLRPWFPGVSLFRGNGSNWPVREQLDGLDVHDRQFFYLPAVLKHLDGMFLARSLDRFIDTLPEKPDLLDAHFAYPTGYGAVRVGQKRGIPTCITLRGTLGSYLGDARRTKLKDALRGADKVIAVSNSLAALADEVAGRDIGVRVIGNGIDTTRFGLLDRAASRRALKLEETGPVLLTVGGLVPRKGVHRVLDVLPRILEQHPTLMYLVVGGASVEGDFSATLRRMVDENGLAEHVRFEGAVAHDDLARYYSAADLFVLPTANEGWANALQESLACGCPVVTTDVGGNREVVGGHSRGFIVPFDDPRALEDAILSGLVEAWDRDVISWWGRRRSWRDIGREVFAVFREIT